MSRRKRLAWPFGLPTKTCESCKGTGAAPGAITAAALRHGLYADVERCNECGGRGRLMDTTGECFHHLQVKDCAICRRTSEQ